MPKVTNRITELGMQPIGHVDRLKAALRTMALIEDLRFQTVVAESEHDGKFRHLLATMDAVALDSLRSIAIDACVESRDAFDQFTKF